MVNNKRFTFLVAVFVSSIVMVMNYIITLILTPYITELLGTDAYGFISLANNIANYATVLTTCLNAYAARFITIAYHKNYHKEANIYLSSVFYGNIALFILVISIALIVIIFLDDLINIPAELVLDAKLLFLYDFVNCMLIAIISVFSVYSYICNRLDIYNIIKLIGVGLQIIVLVILYKLFKPNIQYVGMALLSYSFLCLILNRYAYKKYTPILSIKYSLISKDAIKKLVFSGFWNSLNSLGNILNSGLDLLVTNIMLSALSMGVLSIVKTLSAIFSSLFHLVTVPFQPLLLKEYANNNTQGLIRLFNTGIKTSSIFSNILFAFLFVYGIEYFKLWTPKQNIPLLYKLMVITLIGCVAEGPAYPLFYTYALTLKNRVPCVITIMSGIINIVSMYILLRFTTIGLLSVVVTTSILAWLVYAVFTPLYTERCLKVKQFTFLPVFLRVYLSAISCFILFYLLSKVFTPTNWLELASIGIVLFILGALLHILITFNNNDYKQIKCTFQNTKNK